MTWHDLLGQSSFWDRWLQPDVQQAGEMRWQWANLPESWGVFVWILAVAALATLVYGLYRREATTCPRWLRMVLATLRFAVLLLLVVLLLKPSVYFQQVSVIKPTISVLRDSSLSLGRNDRYTEPALIAALSQVTGLSAEQIKSGERNRSELMQMALNKDDGRLLRSIREKGTIQVSDFADGLTPLTSIPAIDESSEKSKASSSQDDQDNNSDSGTGGSDADVAKDQKLPPSNPSGLGTDLARAIRQTLEDQNRLSAMLLFSEGQHNAGDDPIEAAKQAASLGIPIFTIGIGDPVPPRNFAVNQVYARNQVYPDEPFEIEAVLQATLAVEDTERPEQVDVKLMIQSVDPRTGVPGERSEVKSKTIPVPPAGGRLRVTFDHLLNQPGQYQFSVEVPQLANETDTEDNVQVSNVLEVVDEKVRILLVSGKPNWDYQHLRKLLQQDGSIQLSCWLQSMDETRMQEGNLPITRLPRSLAEISEYNVVILIDPNPEEFDADWINALEEFCRYKAGGLLYMAGPHHTAEFITMNRLKKFLDLLPVRFGDANSIAASQVLAEASDSVSGAMQLVNHNLNHPIMSFSAEPAENQKRWLEMPGFLWNFPTLAAKPTARVLIERGDQPSAEGNQPMLVEGRVGAGSVLFFGFQGTWRWRSVGIQAQYFDRFWIQVVRFLVENRSLQGTRRGFIDLERDEYELGDKITVLARLLDEQFRPSTVETVQALIKDEQGRVQPLSMRLLPNQPGRYEAVLPASRLGSFQATLDLPSNSNEKWVDPVAFRVVTPSIEANAYWLNEKMLREIAAASGGKYYPLHEWEKVISELPKLETRAEFNSAPQPIWDYNQLFRAIALLLPILLLGTEWAVRKWFKLL